MPATAPATAASFKVVNFAILQATLAQIERGLFVAADNETIKRLSLARDAMFHEIGTSVRSRYSVGVTVSKYHEFYLTLPEKAWKKRAGPIVVKAIGYTELKSVYNLMRDAKLADKLGDARRTAMVDRGYDPAARKYAGIARELLPAPRGERPEDADAAVDIAIGKYRASKDRRSVENRQSATDPKAFELKIAGQFTGRIVRFTGRAEGQEPATRTRPVPGQSRTASRAKR